MAEETADTSQREDRAAGASEGSDPEVLGELAKEAMTMALYVAVSTFAALIAVGEDAEAHQPVVLTLIWGTTLGLALAHWFAFRMAARLVGGGRVGLDDVWVSLAQLAGAGLVALLVTVPVVLFPASAELDVARVVLAAFMALVGYLVARGAGAGRPRSLIVAGSTLAIAVAVALVKNILSGH